MEIRFLQWNIWFRENPAKIAKEIENIGAEIICAQEFIQDFRNQRNLDAARDIAQRLGYNYFFKEAETWDNREEKETQGNAILSRFPIVSTSYVYLQEPKHNPPGPSYEGRVYLEADIDINGERLSVGTTHLSYSHRFELTEDRKGEIDNLVAILKEKKDCFVFGGDLNSIPDSYATKEIGKYLVHAGPTFDRNSWTTKPFDYRGFKETELNWRLDYVFTTKDIEVKSAKIVNNPYSDHLPILIEMEI